MRSKDTATTFFSVVGKKRQRGGERRVGAYSREGEVGGGLGRRRRPTAPVCLYFSLPTHTHTLSLPTYTLPPPSCTFSSRGAMYPSKHPSRRCFLRI